jgi:small-conductance mechanosensitive channel/CRP-like cAMP-binding protein
MTNETMVPLLLATLVLVIAAVVPRLRPHWPLWLSVSWRVAVFVVLTVLVQRILGSPLRPIYGNGREGVLLWQKLVEAGWWVIGARVAVGIVRLLVVLEHRPRETQIVSDLMAGAIYVATTLAIVNFVFSVPIGGLLATSGVIAIVLGLALQNTLSDVFSGIAVGLERPYKAGDLLWVEGGIEGHVIQVTWRSTQISTGHNNIAVIPNSIMAKARLVNRSLPTPTRGDSIELRLDPAAASDRCIAALTAATRACRIPLAPPGVVCTGLHGDGVTYEISFTVPSSDRLGKARDELFTQIQRHLRHAGVALAVPGVATVPSISIPTLSQLLEQSDLFGSLEPGDRDSLAEHFTPIWLKTGETLIRIGEMPVALFVIASGAAEITASGPSGPRVVHRMSPGETVGAIGLITNAPFIATATALTPLKAYQLERQAMITAIKASPALAKGLEAVAQRGQAALRADIAPHEGSELDHPEMFLTRLRSFLRLLNG